MTSSVLHSPSNIDFGHALPDRLIVTQRNPETRRYRAVGFLDATPAGFEFSYLRSALTAPGFVPLLGFSDTTRRYRRPFLFPLFAERVISPRRPERPAYLAALDLAEDATPWEILTRSGGHRPGDAIEVLRIPQISADGTTSTHFLVHGVRYRGDGESALITDLRAGDQLDLVPHPANPVNPRALYVSSSGIELGYVPDPLVEYVQQSLPAQPTLTVVRANPPEAGPHMRLLVRLDGRIAGPSPFDGPEWQTVA